MRIQYHILWCLLCCWLFLPVPASGAPPREAADNLYWAMGWEKDKKHSPAFQQALERFRQDQKQGYAAFLAAAWEGDLDALAMLCVATQIAAPKTYSVPAEFWQDWIVKLLGEGEGTCLIAMHHILFLLKVDDADQAVRSMDTASELFRRAALAGNPKGMFGAAGTLDRRAPVDPLPPLPPGATAQDKKALEFSSGSFYGESQYWLVASSVAGDDWAPNFIGIGYLVSPDIEPDPAQAEYFYTIGALRGNGYSAGQMFTCYWNGEFGIPNYYKSLVYGTLAALLREGGELVTSDKEQFPIGWAIYTAGQRWIHGLKGFPKCLTQKEYDDAVAEGTALYRQVLETTAPVKATREALYARARAHLPEVRADFEKLYGGR